jgi:ectoine hydroxylase-related dioxygenase (phytanoyl-CoA dioxygenase family)
MRKIFNDESLQAPFAEKGFVQVPMLAADEIAYLLSQIDLLRPADRFAPTGRDGFDYKYHCSFLDKSVEYKRAAFALMEQVFGKNIEKYLNNYRIISCNFYVKPPGTGEFVIHQNWPMINNINDTTVTVWCPLLDVVATNGALQFVQGSHKIIPHVEGPMCPGYFDKFRKEMIQNHLTANVMKAGEAMIFDDGLIHWSANNDSDKARIAIQIALVPADKQPVFYFFDPAHPERFELVEADREFYLASDVVDLTRRQPHWKHVEFRENRNRFITEQEFIQLMSEGPELRTKIYVDEANPLKLIKAPIGTVALPEKGYKVEAFLDPEQIEALLALHAETVPVVPSDFYNSVYGADVANKRVIFERMKAILGDKIERLAPGYRLLMASFVTKRAGGKLGQLGLHQDPSLVDHEANVGLNVWSPLCDVDEQNGCLRVVDGSPRFQHISAIPVNPSPYDGLRKELVANHLTALRQAAGTACLFDTRVLHATEPNLTDTERVAIFLNLVPIDATPRLHFWNKENPGQLDIYAVDTDFILTMNPVKYPNDAEKARGKFIETIHYVPVPLTATELAEMLPRSPDALPAPEERGTETKAEEIPVFVPEARSGFWGQVRKIFSLEARR